VHTRLLFQQDFSPLKRLVCGLLAVGSATQRGQKENTGINTLLPAQRSNEDYGDEGLATSRRD
jgi:hypothetical protein